MRWSYISSFLGPTKVSVDNLNDYRFDLTLDGDRPWLLRLNPYVLSSEGPIFFLLMIIPFFVLGVVFILKGLNVPFPRFGITEGIAETVVSE